MKYTRQFEITGCNFSNLVIALQYMNVNISVYDSMFNGPATGVSIHALYSNVELSRKVAFNYSIGIQGLEGAVDVQDVISLCFSNVIIILSGNIIFSNN